jgi:periplasmic divalent cation tolerance protein
MSSKGSKSAKGSEVPTSPTGVTFGYCTFPDQTTAEKLCSQLVSEGLVTCANLWNSRSIYTWEGQMHNESEWAALLKTGEAKRGSLMDRFRALHPYKNPCLVFLPITSGLEEFLDWCRSGQGGQK